MLTACSLQMFALLLQVRIQLKKYDYYYNDKMYTIQYVHDTADQIETGTLYNDFSSAAYNSQTCLVAYSSTLRDVQVKFESSSFSSVVLFGVGDFSFINSSVEYLLLARNTEFAIASLGRGILEMANGTLAVRSGDNASFAFAKLGENLALLMENLILNFTATTVGSYDLMAAITYLTATNVSFAGIEADASSFYHAGKPAFSCLSARMNCSTCKQHYYLEDNKCLPLVQVGMNCNGCIRGYVKGLQFGNVDDSAGCYKKVESKKGENCYFGLDKDSPVDDLKFVFRCARCFDSSMDPTKGCEAALPA